MDYSKLVSVTGLPGLFELIASKSDGAIVRSLDDKSTRFVSSRVHNFSHLESIEVYTEADNVNLVDVFLAMQNSSEVLPNEKDAKAVKSYFEKVYPAMDFERVYASDMKKMIKWFDVLKKNEVEIKLSEETTDDDENDSNNEKEEDKDPNKQPESKPAVEEPEVKPAVSEAEPKKAKAARAKKAEPVPAAEDDITDSEPQAAKKKNLKK